MRENINFNRSLGAANEESFRATIEKKLGYVYLGNGETRVTNFANLCHEFS